MTNAEHAAEMREQAATNEIEFERVTLRLAADRLAALAAERDAAVGRVAAMEAACRRAVRYCAGVNLAGPQAARSELSAALLAGEGGGR